MIYCLSVFIFLTLRRPPRSTRTDTLFPSTTLCRSVDRHHQNVVAFAARQWLDMFSPGNLLATNPVVLKRTLEQGGTNLARGLRNAIDDFSRALAGTQPPAGEIRRASCRESACQ